MEQIEDVLDPRLIKLNLEAPSKRDAITQLSETLKAADYINDVPSFVQDIYLREQEGMTGIGDGIAIPHGKSDYVTKVGVAIGIFNHAIEWETLDGKGVSIVILFAVSNDTASARNQLKLLSLFAARLGHEEVIAKLKKATSPAEVIAAFTEKEGLEQ
ncbi:MULTISPECIES: PTS sugar transporter subunit IIA [Lacticaseibacillus]|uniref:PTS fructose transporter subunit IIA n=2 Tax=Lacticaseibacillus TaxID=2759736 RepID=A0AAN1C698_LACCA|nr:MULTISPECIES: PTS sugar transporter subunit IIA [Lacticaseibacillus]ARY90560.1 PTS fructose transporter subunit IIA [Lacticaseibacillus casei]KAB1970417.1 PTS sugar transporter subunit IIA [Lacticaseibacillus casei]WLV81176.1 PTS sugar transporter subunit IIA [Lacticaseibacillus sp. NCIMB 15473]WNX25136.1 PTS sugar transporter subunit IIA [Lacticaseibacillus casei]WNX27907.1 PTS sugar transporter subunit IIA [Lacticaseibacillus casei]